MATTRIGRTSVRGYRWGGDPGPSHPANRVLRLLPVLLVALVTAGVTLARLAPAPAVAGAASVRDQLDAGAAKMEGSIGQGFSFTVVARSTLHAKEGGPKIEIPDPADPYTVAGVVDAYYMGASAARGTVKGGDFFLQMYGGATTEEGAVDIDAMEPTMAALVRGAKAWRNDGEGWYATEPDLVPGIGLDRHTVALLPTLLGHAASPKAAAPTVVAGRSLPTVAATGKVADAPGLMAIDAAPFTEFAQPLAFTFDEQGRLAQLSAVMRNTLMTDFDLMVTTTITFDYDHVDAVPDPKPTAPPTPAPEPDPATGAASEATA